MPSDTPLDLMALNRVPLPEAAEMYVLAGYKIFPLPPGSKGPYKKWPWKEHATSDLATVRGWWAEEPTRNIALVCGEDSGVDVLDIDVKDGQDGFASYLAIVGAPYDGPIQQTPSGGAHYFLRHEPGLKNFTHAGPHRGLDMRTEGGYVVAAPSIVDGEPYVRTAAGAVKPYPPALLAFCQSLGPRKDVTGDPFPPLPEAIPDYHLCGFTAAVVAYLDQGDTTPWRHDRSTALYCVASSMMRTCNDPAIVWGILQENDTALEVGIARRGSIEGGRAWMWQYCVAPGIRSARESEASLAFTPITGAPQQPVAGVQDDLFMDGPEALAAVNLRPDWLIKGVMEQGQVGFLYGDSQSLKSYLMLDLCMALVRGVPWHDHLVKASGPVMYLAGEGNQIMIRRLEAYRQAHGLPVEATRGMRISRHGLNLMDPDCLVDFNTRIHKFGAPRLVVVDTMSTNAILDENSAADAARLIQAGFALARVHGCTVVFVHHTGKSDKFTLRGSSVFLSNADFVYRLERMKGQRIVTQLYVEKLKGAPVPVKPFVFEGIVRPMYDANGPVIDPDDQSTYTELTLTTGSEATVALAAEERKTARLTDRQTMVYDSIKGMFEDHWRFNNPGEGMLREEIWNKYQLLHLNERDGRGPHKSHFDRDVDRYLIPNGLLTQRMVGDQPVLKIRSWKGGT